MVKFRKHKNKRSQLPDGLINSPHRPAPKLIGRVDSMNPLLQDDPQGRHIDDFNRSGGYHPAQPLVSSRTIDRGSGFDESLISEKVLPESLSQPRKRKKDARKSSFSFRSALHGIKQAVIMGGIAIIAITAFLFAKGVINLHKVFGGSSSSIQAIVSPSALHVEGDGRINVLLLGIGGEGHDGPDLTDTMLLASIDSVNHKAVLLSVPRDLWVKVSGFGKSKVNAVYEDGKWKYLGSESSNNQNHQAIDAGFTLDNQIVGQVLGIPIKYDILVDFQAFQQSVDTLGGVNINVPTTLYDPTIAWQNNNNPVIAEQGAQHFDGAQALLYVRSRETTSDYARTQRQRQVLIAVKDKALSLGTLSDPLKISSLSDEFGNNIVSNLSIVDATSLYGIIKGISDNQIQSIGLADPPNNYVTGDTVGSQSVVRPTAGFFNYSQIQYYVRNTLKDGYLAKENASLDILNGSSNPNLGTTEANTLRSYGYNVTSVGNAPTQNYKRTVLVDLSHGSDQYTAHYLELRLGVKAVSQLPDSTIQPGNANFVIILGQDETVNS